MTLAERIVRSTNTCTKIKSDLWAIYVTESERTEILAALVGPQSFEMTPKYGRNTTAAAENLINADDGKLQSIAHHDPDMIRDVAAALIYERKT